MPEQVVPYETPFQVPENFWLAASYVPPNCIVCVLLIGSRFVVTKNLLLVIGHSAGPTVIVPD